MLAAIVVPIIGYVMIGIGFAIGNREDIVETHQAVMEDSRFRDNRIYWQTTLMLSYVCEIIIWPLIFFITRIL